MKKLGFLVMLLLLTGCSSTSTSNAKFTENQAVSFDIVKYADSIAPIYESLVPYIAYANTEGQLKELQARFQMDGFTMDMEKYLAVFLVTYSNDCGISVDGVYDVDRKLSVQLLESSGDACGGNGQPHTFVLQVDKSDYDKVQLYNGNVIKSSVDIE